MGPHKLIKKEQDRLAPPRWTTPDACLDKIERLQKRVMELVETLGQDIALSKKRTGGAEEVERPLEQLQYSFNLLNNSNHLNYNLI